MRMYGNIQTQYFYPRPPRGGRLLPPFEPPQLYTFLSTPSARRATQAPAFQHAAASISIHALREEGDSKNREKTSAFVPL